MNNIGRVFIGLLLIAIGLGVLTGVSMFKYVFAAALIVIGIRMIIGQSFWESSQRNSEPVTLASDEEMIDEVAVFSPLTKAIDSQNLKGGKVVGVVSSCEIDLTQAKARGRDVYFEVSSIFSNVKILIPKNWTVQSRANVFLGKIEIPDVVGEDSPVTLHLSGRAICAEIAVRRG
jgi:predicted membrane protein